MSCRHPLIVAAILGLALPATARAEESFKIGASLGLTGYAAATDRAWRDGLTIAVDALNAEGGLLGRKIELVVEDNRSEPQDAVVAYKKMIATDVVQIFDSGCVSAGNFAAAASVVRARLPMMLCSILPQRPEEQRWAFSFLAPPRFEIDARFRYLKEKTDIRKIGILHDPTPYALLMKDLASKIAADFGMEIVATESYKQDDADISVQLGRINAAGGGAVIKMGQGGSTVTVAKNIKQLGLDKMLLLASTDDGAIFKQAGEVLGGRFLFVAPPVQIPDSAAPGPMRDAIDAFLKYWQAKYPDRDPTAGARAWDSMMVIAKAAAIAKSTDGTALRDAVEKLPSYQGAFAALNFSAEQHVGITENPFRMAELKDGKFAVAP
ncbi:amino acid/amide ABC transporter substrate-binding protein, HAAT family [Rhizobiales bacterium GAS191]|nr:amino acid/amide ABC transporter substrate-binding protein, HAAT family [Rhizobiales bacterium GAS113]SEE19247.1 amino acid/amide ABC transporter substrate-binding protein, HAAT family [Rhizobiales bacterium GAS188]SEE38658.1 amino acid/amide ABC transporter substrate-binding protein, HAAT family [Rhizobiales bacterium GAS191]